MAEGEKIDLAKAVKAPFTGLYWIKCIMFGLGIGCLLFIGIAVKKAYFSKPPATQPIVVEAGGQADIDIHNEAPKKHFYVFTEPFVGVDTKNKGYIGIRAGIRWEY